MIKSLYTVRDESSGLFMDVQVSINHDTAVRNFDYAMAKNDMMGFRPEDFSLWYVGDYDDVTGIVESRNPTCLKRGVKRGKGK